MKVQVKSSMRQRAFALAAVSAVAISGLGIAGSFNPAYAYEGQADNSTGIVWGAETGDEGYGTFVVKDNSGNTMEAYPLNKNDDAPTASTTYSATNMWKDLTPEDKRKLTVATWFSTLIENGGVDKDTLDSLAEVSKSAKGKEAFTGNNTLQLAQDRDILSAAISGLIISIDDDSFDQADLPNDVRDSYRTLETLASLVTGEQDNDFLIRVDANDQKAPIFSAADNNIPPPVISGVELPELAKEEVRSTTTSVTTPVTVTPSSSTTTEEEQTFEPELRTSAGTQSRNLVEPGATITDVVTYTGLDPNGEYRLVGETYFTDTNGVAKPDGNSGEVVFEPGASNGIIDVPIQLEEISSPILVVYETLYDSEGNVVATHHDINDRAQTVGSGVMPAVLKTSASAAGELGAGMTINDTVTYEGLIPGKEYRLEARLACSTEGNDSDGQVYEESVRTHDFSPTRTNGEETVRGIKVIDNDCDDQVVLQKLYEIDENGEEVFVASHEDFDDRAQTVSLSNPTHSGNPDGNTSEERDDGNNNDGEGRSTDHLESVRFGEDHGSDRDIPVKPSPSTASPVSSPQQSSGGSQTPSPESAPQDEPRQTISDVPSGASSGVGSDIFTRG